jgi:hypothetical protein
MEFIMTTEPSFEPTPRQPPIEDPGPHFAIVVGVEPQTNEKGKYAKWLFDVGHNGGTRRITACSSMSLSAKSKAREWIQAILGRPLGREEKVVFSALKGRRCRLLLSEKDLGDGDLPVNRVEKVYRVDKPERKAPAREPEPEAPEPESEEATY